MARAAAALAPLGYKHGAMGADIVPAFPPGFPLVMVVFRRLLGSTTLPSVRATHAPSTKANTSAPAAAKRTSWRTLSESGRHVHSRPPHWRKGR
jgi:hypothetical protein